MKLGSSIFACNVMAASLLAITTLGVAPALADSVTLPAKQMGVAYTLPSGQLASRGKASEIKPTGQEPAPTSKKLPIKIGFSPTAMNTQYDIVIAGARQAIAELGGPSVIDLVIQAPNTQTDYAAQMNIVETWVHQGFDAVALCAGNDNVMLPVYAEAADRGIPIFMFNMPVALTTNPYYVANVGYDQYEAGRLIGLYVAQTFGGKPTNLAILEGVPGIHNQQRLAGFMDGLAGNPNIKIVASQPADWVRDRAQAVTEDFLTAFPGKIDVIWGMYDEMALGAVAAIKSRGLENKIQVIGYDNTPDAYEAITRGDMLATVDTASKEMGYNLVHAIYDHVVKGKAVPKVINSQIVVWDKSNIKNFDTANYKFAQ